MPDTLLSDEEVFGQSDTDYSSTFAQAEDRFGLQPGLLSAIAKQENVDPRHNNPLGLSDDRGPFTFTPEQAHGAIMRQAARLVNPRGPYRDFARTRDIKDLAKVWAPVGARNDVYGTNATEAAGIEANMPQQNLSMGLEVGTRKKSLLTDEDVFGDSKSKSSAPKLLSDEDVFGPPEKSIYDKAKEYLGHVMYRAKTTPIIPAGPGLSEPLYKPESIKAGDLVDNYDPITNQPTGTKHKASAAEAALANVGRSFISGVTSVRGLMSLLPPVFIAQTLYHAPDLWRQVQEAEKTPAWSQERWEAGLTVVGTLGTLGLMSHAMVKNFTARAPAKVSEKLGGDPDASKVTSAESVPKQEVRPQVGEETPLRQQGKTPEARAPEKEALVEKTNKALESLEKPIDLKTVDTESIPANGPVERLRNEAIKRLGLKDWANPQNFSAANDAKIKAKMLELAKEQPDLFEQHGDRLWHKRTGQPVLGPREASKEGWETGEPPGPNADDPYGRITPKLRPGEKGTSELFQGEDQPFNLAGEEGTDFEARQKAAEQAEADREESERGQSVIDFDQSQTFDDFSDAEKERLQREYEAEIQGEVEDHMGRGGDELLDVLRDFGMPAKGSKFAAKYAGELNGLREMFRNKAGWSPLISGEKGLKYSDIFKKDAKGDIDALTQHLRAKGFPVYTIADTLDLIDNRLRSGRKHYGTESLAESLEKQSYGQEDLSAMGATTPGLANKLIRGIQAAADFLSGKVPTAGSLEGPKINFQLGGKKPPPPNSIFGPDTPPDSDPVPYYATRINNVFERWWKKFWPREATILRNTPDSPVITAHEQLIKGSKDYMRGFANSPLWKALRGRANDEIINVEDTAVKAYRMRLKALGIKVTGERPGSGGFLKGMDESALRKQAFDETMAKTPQWFQDIVKYRASRVPIEIESAKELGVDPPTYTGDPYLARLTTEEAKDVIDLNPRDGNLGRQIRTSIGSFDNSRTHLTMKDGIMDGTEYEDAARAVWMRELQSVRLEETAKFVKTMRDKGVLFEDKTAAWKASPKGRITKIRGIGNKVFWARSPDEAIFIDHNISSSPRSPLGKLNQLSTIYFRNPSLFNPFPHVTKNMFFKYVMARGAGFPKLFTDAREYVKKTNPALRERFDKVMPFTDTAESIPQLTASEVGKWSERQMNRGSKINGTAAQFIFSKADPAMRYSLWKYYLKQPSKIEPGKLMGDQEAANHTWIDLVRYNSNSGGMTFWKNIPFNFFIPWRTGTYVTLMKQLRDHPVRSLLFIGSVEYLREMRYRATGRWTHLPIDYMDAPIAEVIDVAQRRGLTKGAEAGAGVAATLALFGPGGGQAPNTIHDVMELLNQDPGQRARVMNMFWGLSQIYNLPKEFNAFRKDNDPQHLVNMLTTIAVSEHSALKYEPRRLMKWLPDWMPGMQKAQIVKEAEALRAKIDEKQQKGELSYQKRHSTSASFEYSPEQQQIQDLRRAAGYREGTKTRKKSGTTDLLKERRSKTKDSF